MAVKLTTEAVDNRLLDKNIKRISDYINTYTKIQFGCLICHYVWYAKPNSIINVGTGCPHCAGNSQLTNDTVDARLQNRNIQRLDDYININFKLNFKCLICNHIWKSSPNEILNSNAGCMRCSNRVILTNQEIDNRLENKQVKRLGNCINNKTKIEFQCLNNNCNYIWNTTPHCLFSSKNGCPKCAGNCKFTNNEIDQKLIELNAPIKRIGNYINIDTKIKFQCLIQECNFIWETAPYNILKDNCGCPRCSANKNEKIIYSILEKNNIDFVFNKSIKLINNNFPNYRFDFFIIDCNSIIEYNGIQHYEPTCFGGIALKKAELNFQKQRQRDLKLKEICKNNNINLIWIDGREYKDDTLKNYIVNEILPIIKEGSL